MRGHLYALREASTHRPVVRWLAAFVLALAIYLPGSSAPFSNTAESQEALVAWEMAESGDWILPRVNGELIPSKPPFYHWLVMSFSAFTGGIDEVSARLPSIAAASATVALVCAVGASRWQPLAGVIAAVVLAASPEWAKWATTARTDATFTFLLTAALLLGERWLRTSDLRAVLALAVATGGATLAKGFAGAALVVLVLLLEIWRRSAWRLLRPLPVLGAAVLFVAIAGSWYVAALLREGPEFFHKQIVLENVLRFLPNEEGGPSRQHARLFYVPMIFVGMLPWSFALPHALLRGYRERQLAGALSGYLVTWVAVVFLVCTAASGKRTNYVLPLYPAAALLIGHQLAVLLEGAREGAGSFTLRMVGWTSATLSAAVAALLVSWQSGLEPWRPITPWLHRQDRLLLPQILTLMGRPGYGVVLVCAGMSVGLALSTLRARWRLLYSLIGMVTVLATLAANATLQHLASALKSFAPFSQRVAATTGGEPLAFYQSADLAVLFYLRRHVPVQRGTFAAMARPGWALVWRKAWDSLPAAERSATMVVDQSPPASIGREETRLLLVRLTPPQ
jgi:4-amino-4-deoxy-L-arabinose transferase-like glycosyltransferase